jgi:hypothetical protein
VNRPLIGLVMVVLYYLMHGLMYFTFTRKLLKLVLPLDNDGRSMKQSELDHGYFHMKVIGMGTEEGKKRSVSTVCDIIGKQGDPFYR